MEIYRVLGLMSGTSLDGLDVAECTFELREQKWHYSIESAITYPYSAGWKKRLGNAEDLTGLDLMYLHNELGNYMGKCVNEFRKGKTLNPDFISSHGHTLFHQPHRGLTFQIGNGACIAAAAGLTTICDFRSLDVALGGQGAPLVPIGDKLLFSDYDYCLNLGGFANISFDNPERKRIAFDICPVNIFINQMVSQRDLAYDPEGSIAEKGTVHEGLLQALNQMEFYHQTGPKSLGKEWVMEKVLPLVNVFTLSLEDILRTFYQHITIQIGNVLKDQTKKGTVLVTGGGTHNSFLMRLFRDNLPLEIVIPPKKVIDFKEALIFAFLGVRRFRGEINCLRSVTGASEDNVGGTVYMIK